MIRNAQADTPQVVRWPARLLARTGMIACLLVAMTGAGPVLAETRIGYVEMKRLLDNAPQMSQGNTRLQAEFADRDRQLRADEARLETLRGQRTGASGDDEIQALERRIQRTRDNLREELRRRSDEEVERNFRMINETVAAYARENNYDLIVHSPVFYASPAIDITDQILARLRAQNADGN